MLILLKMIYQNKELYYWCSVGTPVYNQQNQLLGHKLLIQQDQLLLLPVKLK